MVAYDFQPIPDLRFTLLGGYISPDSPPPIWHVIVLERRSETNLGFTARNGTKLWVYFAPSHSFSEGGSGDIDLFLTLCEQARIFYKFRNLQILYSGNNYIRRSGRKDVDKKWLKVGVTTSVNTQPPKLTKAHEPKLISMIKNDKFLRENENYSLQPCV